MYVCIRVLLSTDNVIIGLEPKIIIQDMIVDMYALKFKFTLKVLNFKTPVRYYFAYNVSVCYKTCTHYK